MELVWFKSRVLISVIVILFLAWSLTKERSFRFRFVALMFLGELALAAILLYFPPLTGSLDFIGKIILKILGFAKEGSTFVFGSWVDISKNGYIFAIQVLPVLIVFSAFTSILFYYGIIQRIVKLLAHMLQRLTALTGIESATVSSNIFLGQMEVVLLLKEYINSMSKREIGIIMAAGMASLSSVLIAVYSKMIGDASGESLVIISRHFLIAAVLSAPSTIIIADIMFPPDPSNEPLKLDFSGVQRGNNILDAILKGTMLGLKVAAQAAAMLIVFIALIAMLNYVMGYVGQLFDINQKISEASGGKFNQLSFQYILGLLLSPLIYLMGVNPQDIVLAGGLLGEKIMLNEFVAYVHLSEWWSIFSHENTGIINIYILSGFANFTSVGILVAGIGAIAKDKVAICTTIGLRAMMAGALASLLSAAIVSLLLF